MRRMNFLILFFFAACSEPRPAKRAGPAGPAASAETPAETAPEAKDAAASEETSAAGIRFVLVSVDGFHAELVGEMPRFREMLGYGAWTLKAVTPVEATTTVSHATMFTGVLSSAHGVRGEAPRNPAELAAWRPLKVRTVFESLDKEKARPLALLQKEKIARVLPDAAFGEDRIVLDRASREDRLIARACREAKDPDGARAIVMHLKRLDAIGHHDGWLTDEQKRGARAMDAALGLLSTCLAEAQAEHGGRFALLITADHGGHDRTHGADRPSDRHVPWLLIGPGIKRGHELAGRVGLEDAAAWTAWFLRDVMAEPPPDMAGAVHPDAFE